MRKIFISITFITIGIFLNGLFLTGTSMAVDGVIEVNQARAEAEISSKDFPGFPVAIFNPGSYVLTSNLNVPKDTDCINIATHNVTLDLNGFTIRGNGGTSGSGVNSVLQSGTYNRISVHNGVVQNMGKHGVHVGEQSLVKTVHAHGNGGSGIKADNDSIVISNTTQGNGNDGIYADNGSTTRDNTAQYNDDGIYASAGSTVISNTVLYNKGYGIYANTGSTVDGNTANNNDEDGISAYYGCTVKGNTA